MAPWMLCETLRHGLRAEIGSSDSFPRSLSAAAPVLATISDIVHEFKLQMIFYLFGAGVPPPLGCR